MAEIKTKPSVIPVFLWIVVLAGILIVVIIAAGVAIGWEVVLAGIFSSFFFVFAAGFGVINAIISRLCTTYTITDDNEIMYEYRFISTRTQIVRLDQITSLQITQNVVQKMLGLATITFGIFGKNELATASSNEQASGSGFQLQSIPKPFAVYEDLASRLAMPKQQPVMQTKPSVTPRVVSGFIWIGLFITIASVLLVYATQITNEWVLVMKGVAGFCGVLVFFLLMGTIFAILRLLNTTYDLSSDVVSREHSYFLSYSLLRVPYKRITNVGITKNVFSHALFGIARIYTYTGGSHDLSLPTVKDYEEFYAKLLSLSKGIAEKTTAESKPAQVMNPSSAFVLSRAFWSTMRLFVIMLIISVIPDFPYKVFVYVFFVVLYVLRLIGIILVWKNMSFEFYPQRIVVNSGVFTIDKHEVPLENLKFFSMYRNVLFDRAMGTGNIVLYTAGTSGADAVLFALKDYGYVYRSLQQYMAASSSPKKKRAKKTARVSKRTR